MRRVILATAVALTAIGVLPNASAQSNTFTVDCDRGQKLAAALEHGDFRKPVVIKLRGTCREFVTIARDNVTLRGDPAAELLAPAQNADLVIIEARGVTLDNLTLTGGRYGVRNNQGFSLIISHCVIQGTSSDGLRGFVGDARLMSTTVRDAGGAGVYLSRGASAGISEDSHIVGNAGPGILADRNSTIVVSDSEISENGSNGVQLQNGSYGSVSGSSVERNGTDVEKAGAGIAVSQAHAGMLGEWCSWGQCLPRLAGRPARQRHQRQQVLRCRGLCTLDRADRWCHDSRQSGRCRNLDDVRLEADARIARDEIARECRGLVVRRRGVQRQRPGSAGRRRRHGAVHRVLAGRAPEGTQPAGVYQIGDVQARSWIETGSPFGTGTPRRAASIVLQRGVGISRTRT